jgi:hypothetical protein
MRELVPDFATYAPRVLRDGLNSIDYLQRIALGNNLKARGSVEAWLSSVEQEMQRSLARMAKDGYKSYNAEPRTEWILQQPAQVRLNFLLDCHGIACYLIAIPWQKHCRETYDILCSWCWSSLKFGGYKACSQLLRLGTVP